MKSKSIKLAKMSISTTSTVSSTLNINSSTMPPTGNFRQPLINTLRQPTGGLGIFRGLPVCVATSFNSGYQLPFVFGPPPPVNTSSRGAVLTTTSVSTPVVTSNLNLTGICGSCSSGFMLSSDRITCNSCPLNFHPSQMCVGLPPDVVNQLIQYKNAGLSYKCTSCRVKPSVGDNSITSLRSAVSQLFESVKGITSVVQNLSLQVSDVVQQLNNNKYPIVSSNASNTFAALSSVDLNNRTLVRQQVKEYQERTKRKFSVIVRGLSASNSDDFSNKFNTISQSLIGCDSQLTNIYCIDASKNLYRANILNLDIRNRILDNAKNLRNINAYNNVYVNRDLTYAQRQELRDRRSRAQNAISTAVTNVNTNSNNSSPIFTTVSHSSPIITSVHTSVFSTPSRPIVPVPIPVSGLSPFLGF